MYSLFIVFIPLSPTNINDTSFPSMILIPFKINSFQVTSHPRKLQRILLSERSQSDSNLGLSATGQTRETVQRSVAARGL